MQLEPLLKGRSSAYGHLDLIDYPTPAHSLLPQSFSLTPQRCTACTGNFQPASVPSKLSSHNTPSTCSLEYHYEPVVGNRHFLPPDKLAREVSREPYDHCSLTQPSQPEQPHQQQPPTPLMTAIPRRPRQTIPPRRLPPPPRPCQISRQFGKIQTITRKTASIETTLTLRRHHIALLLYTKNGLHCRPRSVRNGGVTIPSPDGCALRHHSRALQQGMWLMRLADPSSLKQRN